MSIAETGSSATRPLSESSSELRQPSQDILRRCSSISQSVDIGGSVDPVQQNSAYKATAASYFEAEKYTLAYRTLSKCTDSATRDQFCDTAIPELLRTTKIKVAKQFFRLISNRLVLSKNLLSIIKADLTMRLSKNALS